MRRTIFHLNPFKTIQLYLFSLVGLMVPLNSYAELPAADRIFMRFSEHSELLVSLVQITAVLIGFIFVFKAFLKLKIYGEMRSMMAPHARLNQILLLLFVGTLLIAVPYATRDVLVDAFFGSPTIAGLRYDSSRHFSSELVLAAKRLVRLVGYVAFVRGLVQLGTFQEGGRYTLGKPMTYIVAGIFAINIEQTRRLIQDLFLDMG
jgi:hypothetical protein